MNSLAMKDVNTDTNVLSMPAIQRQSKTDSMGITKYQNYHPLVVKYIGELREEYQKKYAVTFERHISELGKIRQDALKKGAWSAAVNAEVARGKAAGLYIEQKIIRTGKLDDLSEEELEKRMKEIIDQYSPILEGDATELKTKIKDKTKKLRLQGSQHKQAPSLPKRVSELEPVKT